jgi:hypothetical protein
MKMRRLFLWPSADERPSGSTPEDENGADWNLVAELDRLRSTSSGLSAEVQRQTQIGQDYARAASEQRVRVEELERESAIAHTNCQMLERRVSQAEERAAELEELVEALRAQRDRLQTYCEQQTDRADRLDAASAAIRDAAAELLAASDRQTHSALGTRGLARAKVEYADALATLRRSLERNAGKGFLAPVVVDDVRRFFTSRDLAVEEKKKLSQSIVRALSTGD